MKENKAHNCNNSQFVGMRYFKSKKLRNEILKNTLEQKSSKFSGIVQISPPKNTSIGQIIRL